MGEKNQNIVEEFKLGNTIIKIADDAYKDKGEDDIEKILRRISSISVSVL